MRKEMKYSKKKKKNHVQAHQSPCLSSFRHPPEHLLCPHHSPVSQRSNCPPIQGLATMRPATVVEVVALVIAVFALVAGAEPPRPRGLHGGAFASDTRYLFGSVLSSVLYSLDLETMQVWRLFLFFLLVIL